MASHSGTSSGPFTVTVSNLSFGSRGHVSIGVQRLTCPRQRPCGPGYREPVSGQLCRGDRREGLTTLPRGSCRLSAAGIRFFGLLFPPGISALLAVGLPSNRSDPGRGFHVPHIRDATGLGALFTPRPSGALTAGPIPPAAARPLYQRPGPITPVVVPSSGAVSYGASSRVHSRSPARSSPSPGRPPDGTGTPSAFSSGFAPQQARPAAHAKAGDGHRALARSYMTDIVGPPIHALTRNVRPRVARSVWT